MKKYWTVLITASLATLLALFAPALVARADIFQWEYINPANPGLGKQPSATLAPDGAGANAVPAANLANRNLAKAYLIGADLSAIPIYGGELGDEIIGYDAASLYGANLSQADLTNANLTYAWLPTANLSGAEVRGAGFSLTTLYGYGSGLTPAQLYSTASYQAHDLTGIKLEENNLAGVNLAGQNLTNASFFNARLTGANFSQANLTNVLFAAATLTGANLTGAEVRGAVFANFSGDGITAAQLYLTASYLAHDLTGIRLDGNGLTGTILAGQNLTNASFHQATLTGANFHQANLTNAAFSYGGTTLTNANFSQANLTNANFSYAVLTGANLTGAEVRGADFYRNTDYGTGITVAQLYSTASYLAHDLTGIKLGDNNLAGVNLAGQNLTNANFLYATLTGANLSGADARGADFYSATLTGANTSNLIQSNGTIAGLDLTAGESLVVRDYDGNPAAAPPTGPLPIVVEQHLAMDSTGSLQLTFDASHWDSTISFQPGIPVTLGGMLELTFAAGVDVAAQNGRTIDLFNWTGVTPTGTFTVQSPYTWNLSKLYTTGEVTLSIPLAGDYSGNGTVGPEDYNLWKTNFGSTTNLAADGNGNHIVDAADYTVWRDHAATLPLTGDYNGNHIVDAADYSIWRDTLGRTGTNLAADGNGNNQIDSGDYTVWKTHFGAVSPGIGAGSGSGASAAIPEPLSIYLLFAGLASIWTIRRRPLERERSDAIRGHYPDRRHQ